MTAFTEHVEQLKQDILAALIGELMLSNRILSGVQMRKLRQKPSFDKNVDLTKPVILVWRDSEVIEWHIVNKVNR